MSNSHAIEVDQVLRELNTDFHQGLSNEEAKSRLEKYGSNELKKEKKLILTSTLFISKLKNALILILLTVAVFSVLVPLIFGISIPDYWMRWFRIDR